MRIALAALLTLSLAPAAFAQDDYPDWPEVDPLSPERASESTSDDDRGDADKKDWREDAFLGHFELSYRAQVVPDLKLGVLRQKRGGSRQTTREDDLGMDDDQLAHTLMLRLSVAQWLEIRLEYTSGLFKGKRTIPAAETVSFNGESFSAEEIETEMLNQVATLEFLFGWQGDHFKIGLSQGVRLINTEIEIEAANGDRVDKEYAFNASVYGIEARFRTDTDPLNFEIYLTSRAYIFYDWTETASAYFDVELGVSLTVAETVSVMAGYRYLTAYERNNEGRNQKVEWQQGGPTVGVAIRF